MPECMKREAHSQHHEDIMVTAALRCMKNGRPGTFVELGAFTGVALSNTVMLERCYNYTGVLIEASPINYAKLKTSGRQATLVHSAVCPTEGTVMFQDESDGNGDYSGEIDLRHLNRKETLAKVHNRSYVTVPCRPLGKILDDTGYAAIDILFLDVEGAEGKVLASVDLKRFSVVVMEAAEYPNDGGRLRNQLEPMLRDAGFQRQRAMEDERRGQWNPAYVRVGSVNDTCVSCMRSQACRNAFFRDAPSLR